MKAHRNWSELQRRRRSRGGWCESACIISVCGDAEGRLCGEDGSTPVAVTRWRLKRLNEASRAPQAEHEAGSRSRISRLAS